MSIKTYSELITIQTFEERFEYLKLEGSVGNETFGYDRYLNQILYHSNEWKHFRRKVIDRDNACDMACEGFILYDRIIIHHINPITIEDILNRRLSVFDFDNAVCVSHLTHQAIHYSNIDLLSSILVERSQNDTCPWRR